MIIQTSLGRYVSDKKVKEQYPWIKKNISQDHFAIETSIACINPIQEYHISKEWRNFLAFVNKYIILELGTASTKTIEVRLRIAVNLLDKVDCIEDWKKPMIHATLVNNVWHEIYLMDFEDLPF